jgi:hypothetical protein
MQADVKAADEVSGLDALELAPKTDKGTAGKRV